MLYCTKIATQILLPVTSLFTCFVQFVMVDVVNLVNLICPSRACIEGR